MVYGSLHKGCFEMKRPGGIQPLGISFSCWFSRLSNPSCHLISFAHLWYLLLSASCTSKKSRLSASVNLLILYRMEPLRGKRLSPQYEALGDLLKPSSFLLSNPLMWHKSLWWRNGSPIRRFASGVFTCIFVPCVWRVSYKHSWEAAGEAWMSPLAVLWRKEKRKKKKPWPHPKTQVGGLAVLAVVPQSLNLIPANLDIVIHLELTVWLTSKPKQHCSAAALLSLAFISAYPRSLFSASHHAFILSPNIPVVSPPSAHCVSVLCSLWQGEYRQGII